MTGFMRRRIGSSEKEFTTLLIDGDVKFQESFKLISDNRIPIILGLGLMVLFALQPLALKNFQTFCVSLISIGYVVIAYPFWFVAFMVFFWVYLCSIRGLFDLGKNRIRLKSFREDKMLGVKPFGSLSLNFSYAYFFSLILILLFAVTISPNTPTVPYLSLITVLILIGIIFFILPLYTIHIKMVQYKKQEQDSFQIEVGKVINKSSDIKDITKNDAIYEIKDALSN
ncbi:MAG: hypothetical protein NTY03_00090, partial [Candidatus Bathyarchaeota archaeon]|nr:hypothetical protein [Candidatus Bathyarchaeota archaeon]